MCPPVDPSTGRVGSVWTLFLIDCSGVVSRFSTFCSLSVSVERGDETLREGSYRRPSYEIRVPFCPGHLNYSFIRFITIIVPNVCPYVLETIFGRRYTLDLVVISLCT